MLTTTAKFKQTMGRAGIQPVYVVELHLSSTDVRYFSTCHLLLSDLAAIPLYPSVSDVVGVASSIDVESRSVSIGEFHVHFLDDGVLRDIIKNQFVYGKKVVIKLGNDEMTAYSDFLQIAVGVSRDIIPTEGELDLEVADILELLKDKDIGPRFWLNAHPLEVIEDILKAAQIDSSMYDSSTLSATSDLTRSHFVCSRYDARIRGIDEPIVTTGVNSEGSAADGLINEICELVYGSFAPDESGVFKFKYYEPTNSVDRNLQEDDFGGFEQTASADPLYNSISFFSASITRKANGKSIAEFTERQKKANTQEFNIGFRIEDTDSQARYNYGPNTIGTNTLTIETPWLAGPSKVNLCFKDISGTLTREASVPRINGGIAGNTAVTSILFDHDAINLLDASYNGFCGSSFDLGTIPAASRTGAEKNYPHAFPVKANRTVSASRPVYLLIEGYAEVFTSFAKVKTQPTVGDVTIELKFVAASNYVNGSVAIFGNDQGPNNAGYSITSYDSTAQTITLATGILTAVAVDTPIYFAATGRPLPAIENKYFQTEIVKCISAESYKAQGINSCIHGELFRWPGADGCLGPWDTRTQRLPRSEELAITCIGTNPTVAVEGDGRTYEGTNFRWPYETLYNMRYPIACQYRFEGTSGAVGTNPNGHPGLGSAASGRGQFGTETPFAWRNFSTFIGDTEDGPGEIDNADGLFFAKVWDITILVDSVQRRMARFKNGMARARIKTTLAHADIQLGDFITLTTNLYSSYGRDGADANVVWEVVSKTVDALADDPGCEFELAWVRDDGVAEPASTLKYTPFVKTIGTRYTADTVVFSQQTSGVTDTVLTTTGLEVKSSSGA